MKETTVSSFVPPRYAWSMSEHHDDDILHAEGQTGDKTYLATIDIETSISSQHQAGCHCCPARERPAHMVPLAYTTSGKTLPILNKAVVKLTLGWLSLPIWVPIVSIADEFILQLDVLHPRCILGFQTLRAMTG
jgi:hypothetical protein